MTGRYEGKVAVVTGAATGIGEAYARGLDAEGAAVVVADIHDEAGEKVAHSIRSAGGREHFVPTDVSDPAPAQAVSATAVDAFGAIDLCVYNHHKSDNQQ